MTGRRECPRGRGAVFEFVWLLIARVWCRAERCAACGWAGHRKAEA